MRIGCAGDRWRCRAGPDSRRAWPGVGRPGDAGWSRTRGDCRRHAASAGWPAPRQRGPRPSPSGAAARRPDRCGGWCGVDACRWSGCSRPPCRGPGVRCCRSVGTHGRGVAGGPDCWGRDAGIRPRALGVRARGGGWRSARVSRAGRAGIAVGVRGMAQVARVRARRGTARDCARGFVRRDQASCAQPGAPPRSAASIGAAAAGVAGPWGGGGRRRVSGARP